MATRPTTLPEAQRGPAEKLLELVLSSHEHLWHHRPGYALRGVWYPKLPRVELPRGATRVSTGLFAPAAVRLYARLLELWQLNAELAARFASYVLLQSEWRDVKVASAALMLVQPRAGQPIRDERGEVAFHEDDHRAIGEAMLLRYEKKSSRMLTPKGVLRVAELLELPEIARLNRRAGFADPSGRKAPLGRWKKAAEKWLRLREQNPQLLEGLVRAGYKETIKKLARKAGYEPESAHFFEVLGWKQAQAKGGHRTVGLTGLKLKKAERFDGLSEEEICEWIELERLNFRELVGRLPSDVGLTPAIFAACLPTMSDKELRDLTPTIEQLGLMADPAIRARWEAALTTATDQRSLQVAKNVRSEEVKEKLQTAADHAVKRAVKAATVERDVRVFFLVDKSGSMEGAIAQSKEALSRLLAGFPLDRLHVATFDTLGTVLVPKAASRAAVLHLLAPIRAEGGTMHASALRALHRAGVRVKAGEALLVIVVGDEAGEAGDQLAKAFQDLGYAPAAIALLVSLAPSAARGSSVRSCARLMQVPFSEVNVDSFADPYQVPRVLQTLLAAPVPAGGGAAGMAVHGWVEKVMRTPLLTLS